MGFHIDACLVRQAHHKGKVERRVRDVRNLLGLKQRVFESLEDLQAYTDERMAWAAANRRCPASLFSHRSRCSPGESGAEGSRTLDLGIANAALSQLSYRPRIGNAPNFRSVVPRCPYRLSIAAQSLDSPVSATSCLRVLVIDEPPSGRCTGDSDGRFSFRERQAGSRFLRSRLILPRLRRRPEAVVPRRSPSLQFLISWAVVQPDATTFNGQSTRLCLRRAVAKMDCDPLIERLSCCVVIRGVVRAK